LLKRRDIARAARVRREDLLIGLGALEGEGVAIHADEIDLLRCDTQRPGDA
jgi:hypothetical protein